MTNRYNWFPNKVLPVESQWSLLHKFCKWNSFSVAALYRAIGGKYFSKKDLSFGQFFDLEKIKLATGFDQHSLLASLSRTFLHERDLNLLHRTLRFCPECLSRGYHSSLFQIDIIECCPIHNKKFENICPFCGNSISMIICSDNFISPYGCPSCLRAFCKIEGPIDSGFKISDFEEIINIGKHLKTIRSIKSSVDWKIHPPLQWSKYKNLTLEIWKNLFLGYDEVVPGIIHSIIKEPNHIVPVRGKLLYYWKLYIEIHDLIYTLFIKNHEKCLFEIRSIGGAYSGLSCSESLGCPIAHAFIMWKMYWEGLQSLSQVNNYLPSFNQFKDDLFDYSLNPFYTLRVNDLEILPFAYTCFDSFYGFYCLANQYQETNSFEIPDKEIMKVLVQDVICLAKVAKADENSSSGVLHIWRPVWHFGSDHEFCSEHFKEVEAGVVNIGAQLKRSSKRRLSRLS